jgi:hypothetical protein
VERLVRAPHQDRHWEQLRHHPHRQRRGPEQRLQRRQTDRRRREDKFEHDAAEQEPVGRQAHEAQRYRSVRAAKTVPTWQNTIAAKLAVVACR